MNIPVIVDPSAFSVIMAKVRLLSEPSSLSLTVRFLNDLIRDINKYNLYEYKLIQIEKGRQF